MYISAKWSSAGLCNRLVLATLAASQPATQPASQRGPCNYLELSSAGVGLAPSDDVGSAHGDFFCPPAALGVSVTLPVPLALCMVPTVCMYVFADPPQHSRTCRGRMSCLHSRRSRSAALHFWIYPDVGNPSLALRQILRP